VRCTARVQYNTLLFCPYYEEFWYFCCAMAFLYGTVMHGAVTLRLLCSSVLDNTVHSARNALLVKLRFVAYNSGSV